MPKRVFPKKRISGAKRSYAGKRLAANNKKIGRSKVGRG